MSDREPKIGDSWRHKTMPETVTILDVEWSDGIRWVKVQCAAGVRNWMIHEWYQWAANAERVDPKPVRGKTDARSVIQSIEDMRKFRATEAGE